MHRIWCPKRLIVGSLFIVFIIFIYIILGAPVDLFFLAGIFLALMFCLNFMFAHVAYNSEKFVVSTIIRHDVIFYSELLEISVTWHGRPKFEGREYYALIKGSVKNKKIKFYLPDDKDALCVQKFFNQVLNGNPDVKIVSDIY